MNDRRAIDLRSDTITQPTLGMRAAMANAEVGDDVFGDDPTVQRLEARVAEMLGKEAALFMPSGTMANQLAVRAHPESGDEILIDANAHIYYYEAAGPAALSGVSCRCLNGVRGIFTATDVETAVRPPSPPLTSSSRWSGLRSVEAARREAVAAKLGLPVSAIGETRLRKHSIDALQAAIKVQPPARGLAGRAVAAG
jgi:hypothetical protein